MLTPCMCEILFAHYQLQTGCRCGTLMLCSTNLMSTDLIEILSKNIMMMMTITLDAYN
jgi:hypothetical protein